MNSNKRFILVGVLFMLLFCARIFISFQSPLSEEEKSDILRIKRSDFSLLREIGFIGRVKSNEAYARYYRLIKMELDSIYNYSSDRKFFLSAKISGREFQLIMAARAAEIIYIGDSIVKDSNSTTIELYSRYFESPGKIIVKPQNLY